MNFNNRPRTSNTRSRIYSNNQIYNNAFMLHFETINNLTNIINESNNLLIEYNTRNNSNNNSYSSNNISNSRTSNLQNNNYSNEMDEFENNISYLFRFDTLFPNSIINNNRDISYNIVTINDDNSELLDISDNNADIFNIINYGNITNPINDICPITRDRFFTNQNVYMIKNCKHIFNKSALNIWINNNNTCPTCRRNIR